MNAKYRVMLALDTVSHWLRLPRWVVCDRFEKALWADVEKFIPKDER